MSTGRTAAGALLAAAAAVVAADPLCPADAVAAMIDGMRRVGGCGGAARRANPGQPCLRTIAFRNEWGVFHVVLELAPSDPGLAGIDRLGPTSRRERLRAAALAAARWYGLPPDAGPESLLAAAPLAAAGCDAAATRERMRGLSIIDARVPAGAETWEVTVYPDGTTRGPRPLPGNG